MRASIPLSPLVAWSTRISALYDAAGAGALSAGFLSSGPAAIRVAGTDTPKSITAGIKRLRNRMAAASYPLLGSSSSMSHTTGVDSGPLATMKMVPFWAPKSMDSMDAPDSGSATATSTGPDDENGSDSRAADGRSRTADTEAVWGRR